MGLHIKNYTQAAIPAHVKTEIQYRDDRTQIRFHMTIGSLHVYPPTWGSHPEPLNIAELQQIHEALGRFIEALIPEEVK